MNTFSRLILNPIKLAVRQLGRISLHKNHPMINKSDNDEVLLFALERLALTAPHLLEDIGFVEVAEARAPLQNVWRRGALRLVLTTSTPPTAHITAH